MRGYDGALGPKADKGLKGRRGNEGRSGLEVRIWRK
jgi:hypothetical protein